MKEDKVIKLVSKPEKEKKERLTEVAKHLSGTIKRAQKEVPEMSGFIAVCWNESGTFEPYYYASARSNVNQLTIPETVKLILANHFLKEESNE